MEKLELVDVMMQAISHALADMHTATIAKVTGVNAKTINCRPVTNRMVDGVSVQLPEFVEVPVWVAQGGTSYTAYPIAVGDYCLLIFTERCFDRWYVGQDFQPPLEMRMHDYSDGIALVGLNPLSTAITIPTTIRQNGDMVHTGDYTHTGNLTRTGDTTLTGDYTQTGDMTVTGNVQINGNLTVTGAIIGASVAAGAYTGTGGGAMTMTVDLTTTGDLTAGTISLKNHTHPVTTAPGTTGVPS